MIELGYFLGNYGRLSRRIYLFQHGELELPSIIDGFGRIRLSGDIDDDYVTIRRELDPWL